MKLPEEFCRKMERLLGEQYQEFLEGYEKERACGLRFNALKSDGGEQWLQRAKAQLEQENIRLTQIPWVKEGFYYPNEERPGKHPLHEAGMYYIQEPSAMAVVSILDPKPGERILDLCAAPGGKTTQIASRLSGKGLLVSNEPHPARAKILSQNVERMGIYNGVVTCHEPQELSPHFPEYFHRIVVDAPCSGEGMFRKEPEAAGEWSPSQVDFCARRQRRILEEAAKMLLPGGSLVYSTCTFSPEENEGVIADFLKAHPEFHIQPAPDFPGFSHGRPEWAKEGQQEGKNQAEQTQADPLGLRNTVRIFPHLAEGEGHFIALLRKDGEEGLARREETHWKEAARREGSSRKKGQAKDHSLPAPQEYLDFVEAFLNSPRAFLEEGDYILFGDQLYRAPILPGNFKGLKVLRPGLHLGTLKKNRFEPAQALAMALRPGEAALSICLDPQGEEIRRYLKGEALTADLRRFPQLTGKKGWVLVCAGTCSAGWAKLAGNVLKNHYPKGLRREL